MDASGRIVVAGLTKTFGTVKAVEQLSFTVEPGKVTGFLGPNGAGKTTTLRMLLRLVTPDAGSASIGGRSYADLPAPSTQVGAVLEATGFHPARTGRNHLRVYCTLGGHPLARADQVLELVGLAGAGRRAVRGYSLGMRQRLALATALLGDPPVLVLDEPTGGLDPEGIAWLRGLLRQFASHGRTVLVSSHVLSEVQQLVDQVVIINNGRLLLYLFVVERVLTSITALNRWTRYLPGQAQEALVGSTLTNQRLLQLWQGGLALAAYGLALALAGTRLTMRRDVT